MLRRCSEAVSGAILWGGTFEEDLGLVSCLSGLLPLASCLLSLASWLLALGSELLALASCLLSLVSCLLSLVSCGKQGGGRHQDFRK